MFDARLPRELGSLALSWLGSLLGWLLIAPFAALVPKRRDWIAVIGRQHGKFLDNAKYFHLQAGSQATGLRVVFISERADVVAPVRASGLQALRYPGLAAAWYLARCGCAVADSTDWGRRLRRFLLIRARTVQLWHGVGFKRIELDKWRNETGRYRWFARPRVFALRMVFYRFTGRATRYDAVCATSAFYRDQVFAPAFLARSVPVTGYPRNDFARSLQGAARALAWHNVDREVASKIPGWLDERRRLVLIAPTMRDSSASPIRLDADITEQLDAFATTHGVEFLFKFHPSEARSAQVGGTHLHVCDPDSDVYPLLPSCAALVTDYSSIYMDFLLVDRPVLFLVPDGGRYMSQDRQVQFDPATMMPGPLVTAWPDLMDALLHQWREDGYADDRARLRELAFDGIPQAQASQRLLDTMREHGWVVPAPVTGDAQ